MLKLDLGKDATADDYKAVAAALEMYLRELDYADYKVSYPKGNRTVTQNSAMWQWLTMVAEGLNDAGLEQRTVLSKMREGFDVPWNKDTAKQNMYNPIMEAMTGKTSSTELDTVEPSKVCETLGRWLSSELGYVPPPWPSIENQDRERQAR